MKLIIGGYAQGKSKYGEARFPGHILYDEANFSLLYREAPGTGIRKWKKSPGTIRTAYLFPTKSAAASCPWIPWTAGGGK